MLETFLQTVTPFHLLTPEQADHLVNQGENLKAERNEILFTQTNQEDCLLLILTGSIVLHLQGKKQGHVYAPAYLGEQTVFLNQPYLIQAKALTHVDYVRLPGHVVRHLALENKSFAYGFATVLKDKYRIFQYYAHFTAHVMTLKKQKIFQLQNLLGFYEELKPLLHRGCQTKTIDFAALSYVLARLPTEITSAHVLVLTEDPPAMYHDVMQAMQIKSPRGEKKRYYAIAPGKILCLLRDDYTDYLDLMTKLCVYAIESHKIRQHLLAHDWVVTELAKIYWEETYRQSAEGFLKKLPFSKKELMALQHLFGKDLLKQLYHIVVQYGNLTVTVHEAGTRYFALATENWAHQLNQGLKTKLSSHAQTGDVHLILSNRHSVVNCLSTWLHENRKEIMQWALNHLPDCQHITDRNQQLYYAARHWLAAFPARAEARTQAEQAHGIWRINTEHPTGIEVQLIERKKGVVLVNIDYAYGKQARAIMQHLLLLFGTQISSVSIFGKAGAVRGQRGDILFPSHFLGQETEALYPLINNDLQADDFTGLLKPNQLHSGMMLTVVGTLLQNSEMLHYYRYFNQMIGMEMEGAYYLHELTRAQQRGIIAADTPLRVCYYTSDLPLEEGLGLTQPLTAWEGLPTVYAITHVMLTKILGKGWHE